MFAARAAAFSITLALALGLGACGDDTETVNLDGAEVELPTDIDVDEPQEALIEVTDSLLEQSGYTDAVRDCYLEEIEALPESRFEGLLDLAEDEIRAAQFELAQTVGAACLRNQTVVLRADASPEALDLYRVTIERSLENAFLQAGLSEERAACVAGGLGDLSDPDLIEWANGTAGEQRTAIKDWTRDCA